MLSRVHVLTATRAAGDGCLKEATYAAACLDSSCEIVCVGADMMHELLYLDLHQPSCDIMCAFNMATTKISLKRSTCGCVLKTGIGKPYIKLPLSQIFQLVDRG